VGALGENDAVNAVCEVVQIAAGVFRHALVAFQFALSDGFRVADRIPYMQYGKNDKGKKKKQKKLAGRHAPVFDEPDSS
jgi:hypothetical protein